MHPIENIMQTAMSEIKEMVDVNTIVGDPVISTDGATIIPITRVSFGFVAGGGEYGEAVKARGSGQQDILEAGGCARPGFFRDYPDGNGVAVAAPGC